MQPYPKQILLVEDEIPIATALKKVLSARGFAVELAHTAHDARLVLKEKQFDLLILDLILPDAHGLGLLSELHEIQSALPVMILSNVSVLTTTDIARGYGVCDYVVKTHISLKDLEEKIVEVIESGKCSRPFDTISN